MAVHVSPNVQTKSKYHQAGLASTQIGSEYPELTEAVSNLEFRFLSTMRYRNAWGDPITWTITCRPNAGLSYSQSGSSYAACSLGIRPVVYLDSDDSIYYYSIENNQSTL